MSTYVEIAVEFLTYGLNALFVVVLACIFAAFGLCYYDINRFLPTHKAREVTRVVVGHQLVVIAMSVLLMIGFVWYRPDFMPQIFSLAVVPFALNKILDVAFVNNLVHSHYVTPEIDRTTSRDPAPN